MVQRMVRSKLGIQADYAKSDKGLANPEPSFFQHQDGKGRGTDKMNKMKKSRSIQLSYLEPLQSSRSVRSLSQPRKTPALHVPTTVSSTQQQKPMGSSPNYMKPTTSSDAKKELLSVSLQGTQSGSDSKNPPQKCSSNSKASSVFSTGPAKTFSRSSSFNSVRTLTETPSSKPCKACLRKSTSTVLFQDMNVPDTATCSSTLKDSKFPPYLTLHPGGTESEGASVTKVCPYTYCSLNDHSHVSLPPLKSFLSERRHLLDTQKNIKREAVSPQRWKVPCDTKKDSDIEQVVFGGNPACDEADMDHPAITPLSQEIDMDFIEISYTEEADKMSRFNSVKDLEDKKDIDLANEENGNAAEEHGIKQVTTCVTHDLPKSHINFEEYFKKNFDDAAAIEANTKRSFHLERNVKDDDENHPPGRFHEESCRGNYCNEGSSDGEHQENIELDEYDSRHTDMYWEEEQFSAFNIEEDTNSSIGSMEETDSKHEYLSENSHGMSEIRLDDIFSSHYADILVEEALQEPEKEKSYCSEAQSHSTDSVHEDNSESMELETHKTHYPSSVCYEYDQSILTEEVLEFKTNAEDNNRENHKCIHSDASCVSMVLDEEMIENSEGHKTSDTCRIDEGQDSKASLENNDDQISQELCEDRKVNQVNNDGGSSQENLIPSSDMLEEITTVQDQKLLEEYQVKASKFHSTCCASGEKQHTTMNWQRVTKRKRQMEDDKEMRKINPRKPNFLPLVPPPEPEKIDLKHQTINERKNAENWMLDFAVRQAVTRLAPAGKGKVALLVQAFETVMSNPKCETHMRNGSTFAHARPIQACS